MNTEIRGHTNKKIYIRKDNKIILVDINKPDLEINVENVINESDLSKTDLDVYNYKLESLINILKQKNVKLGIKFVNEKYELFLSKDNIDNDNLKKIIDVINENSELLNPKVFDESKILEKGIEDKKEPAQLGEITKTIPITTIKQTFMPASLRIVKNLLNGGESNFKEIIKKKVKKIINKKKRKKLRKLLFEMYKLKLLNIMNDNFILYYNPMYKKIFLQLEKYLKF